MLNRKLATLAVLTSVAIGASACESAPSGTPATSGSGEGSAASAKVAFLMPDLASTRYELQDAPLFKAKMKQLCADCEVIYQNANADSAKQQQQADSAIAQGIKVLVLDPVDSAAAATIVNSAQGQGVKVISYDRPIPAKPADFYVSFDNEKIGAAIAQSLVDKLKVSGTPAAGAGILQINGSPTDAAAGLIKKGIHSAIDSSGIPLLAEYDTPNWEPAKAQSWASGQITQFGGKIIGVVAANDGTGGGAVSAFKSANVSPVPPVTGNDAELAAVQRVISGDQFNTISKPIKIVAEAAAEAAYAFVQGKTPEKTADLYNTPSQLFVPDVVTTENVKEILFDSGIFKAADVCTGPYAAGCTKLGIS